MPQTLRFSSRMDAIQTPIVQVIGDLIRQTPGTISLGQGVVHYGPPPEALAAARAAVADPETHGYGDGNGNAELIEAIDEKLRRDNRIDPRGSRVMVTAGGNMAFVHAILAIREVSTESGGGAKVPGIAVVTAFVLVVVSIVSIFLGTVDLALSSLIQAILR